MSWTRIQIFIKLFGIGIPCTFSYYKKKKKSNSSTVIYVDEWISSLCVCFIYKEERMRKTRERKVKREVSLSYAGLLPQCSPQAEQSRASLTPGARDSILDSHVSDRDPTRCGIARHLIGSAWTGSWSWDWNPDTDAGWGILNKQLEHYANCLD